MSSYLEHGYRNRSEYLKGLSEEYDVPLDDVRAIANVLGPYEDFDGLIAQLDDMIGDM